MGERLIMAGSFMLLAIFAVWFCLTLFKGPEFVCTGEKRMECHWVRE